MLVPELDRVLHCLITDLQDRGLLESTLVIAWVNWPHAVAQRLAGRDHYPMPGA